ncbi:hypothetical protein I3760_07G217300 [Carya illinoinensis]|nr:hypothetical protein I3760_07G217300 [Carya illinoinensis]
MAIPPNSSGSASSPPPPPVSYSLSLSFAAETPSSSTPRILIIEEKLGKVGGLRRRSAFGGMEKKEKAKLYSFKVFNFISHRVPIHTVLLNPFHVIRCEQGVQEFDYE